MVQSAEASPDESLTEIPCAFSTEFSTEMLKTRSNNAGVRAIQNKKSRQLADGSLLPRGIQPATSSSSF
jgi:hypothetical protein